MVEYLKEKLHIKGYDIDYDHERVRLYLEDIEEIIIDIAAKAYEEGENNGDWAGNDSYFGHDAETRKERNPYKTFEEFIESIK